MTKIKLTLQTMADKFAVHRFSPEEPIPEQVFTKEFFNICRTRDELSVVCSQDILLASETSEPGWACIQVVGPLDFSLTGILADISTILAREGISMFAMSTYDTDYILVKTDKLDAACRALVDAGHRFN